MANEQYHLRRIERDMPDRADQLAVLRGQKYLSLAMACDNRPYLVSLTMFRLETVLNPSSQGGGGQCVS